MTGEARAEILARIRRAVADGFEPTAPSRRYEPAGSAPAKSADELTLLLVERLTDYRATVTVCIAGDLAACIAARLAEHSVRRLVVPVGFSAEWLVDSSRAGVEVLHDDPPMSKDDLDGSDGVISTCAVAIAETGTIVLDGGLGQGRRIATLLPDYHLCVVMDAQIVDDVPDAVAFLDPHESGHVRPQTWISGPSATSDIELVRIEGVHGPRTLDVILVASS